MTDVIVVRTRTRTTPPIPVSWPNGAEIYSKPVDTVRPFMGWSIRLPSSKYRLWIAGSEVPVYLGDFDTFSDGLIRLSAAFEQRIISQKKLRRKSPKGDNSEP